MKLILNNPYELRDADGSIESQQVEMPVGEYEVERIPHPYGRKANWIVLVGTKIGATEGLLRSFSSRNSLHNGEVVLIDDDGRILGEMRYVPY